ncbi:MAG: hypothetical protein B7Y16_00695 [Methylotenera sp. 24-45-7]|jgi:uncharacterized protein (DUF2147 family)|nr:MAG: hypothetical protein B7Y72_02245 [Mehylophilales bacterium 35-46-6]OYZ41862.1 MAG: hypothetical protein B7Y16_00695 [Methylotenera sp. 24-45-7]OZA09436.1 MAG: hypothetical protein B7X97_02530 [Methylotenera sp. 17-45-7]OZA53327.1 MAG: hypothetical protein B7X73_04805 [Methylophilales bacterium 39-45-7]
MIMKSKLIVVLSLLIMGFYGSAFAATPAGLWRTIDDNTGKPRSLVRINESNGEFSAVIEKGLLASDTPDAVCDKCKDERKGQRIVGMTIVKGIKLIDGHYEGGEILDPENGKTYRCLMKLDSSGNQLEVRGYIGISLIGRSQTWTRVE